MGIGTRRVRIARAAALLGAGAGGVRGGQRRFSRIAAAAAAAAAVVGRRRRWAAPLLGGGAVVARRRRCAAEGGGVATHRRAARRKEGRQVLVEEEHLRDAARVALAAQHVDRVLVRQGHAARRAAGHGGASGDRGRVAHPRRSSEPNCSGAAVATAACHCCSLA